MKALLYTLPLICCLCILSGGCSFNPWNGNQRIHSVDEEWLEGIKGVYQECELSETLRYDIFRRAMIGCKQISGKNPDIITIIDYTKPSTDKRFHVIDVGERKVLFSTHVAHGENSGRNYATDFSNEKGSRKSSLGFYKTAETYQGRHNYSLKLDGLEKGINHYARARYIVIHSAGYVSPEFIRKHGRLGRSWGCPALPEHISKDIIDAIKGGRCLYTHADDEDYLERSRYGRE